MWFALPESVGKTSWMIARLNAETAVHHRDADADFDALFAPDVTATDYLVFLVRSYGFEAPLEGMLALTPSLEPMRQGRDRGKSHYLAQDLVALGVRPSELTDIPQCLAIPQFRGAAEALGWMFVGERATLKHSLLLRHLQTRLSKEMRVASSYLTAYEGRVGARWRELGDALDRIASQPVIADRILAAAHDAFRTHKRWVRQDHRTEQLEAV